MATSAVVFTLAVAAAGAIGLSSLAGGAERVRADALAAAEPLARELGETLDRLATELATGTPEWALGFRSDELGTLLEPDVGGPPRRSIAGELVAGITREVDTLDREGDREAGDRRLAEVADHDDRPSLAAWALSWLAARQKDPARARELRERLVRDFGEARDARGLRLAFAARADLLPLDDLSPNEPGHAAPTSEDLEALLELHADLLADRRSLDDRATAFLAERVAERILVRDPDRAGQLAVARAASDRPLEVFADWSLGASDWIARDARNVSVLLAGAASPGGARVLAARPDGSGGFVGAAVELHVLATLALERAGAAQWRELGFEARVLESPDVDGASDGVSNGASNSASNSASRGASRGASNGASDGASDGASRGGGGLLDDVTSSAAPEGSGSAGGNAPLATARPGTPFETLRPSVRAIDFAERVQAEERRFAMALGGFLVALLAAGTAGFAVVRTARREELRAREREAFVAAVTHELKTPVASIRLMAELLERGDAPPERAREFARRTVLESERLERLVDSVLRFAGTTRGGRVANLVAIDLQDVLDSARTSIQPVADERGFELRVADPPADLAVRAERDALVGAVTELLDNATKYGDPAAGVDLEVIRRGDRVRLEVSDRGPGVPETERDRIFEPFRRLGDELTREQRGIGLGLALVRATAESFGGSAGYAARAGGGASLWIELECVAASHDPPMARGHH